MLDFHFETKLHSIVDEIDDNGNNNNDNDDDDTFIHLCDIP